MNREELEAMLVEAKECGFYYSLRQDIAVKLIEIALAAEIEKKAGDQ